jgi:hypothetical protein
MPQALFRTSVLRTRVLPRHFYSRYKYIAGKRNFKKKIRRKGMAGNNGGNEAENG